MRALTVGRVELAGSLVILLSSFMPVTLTQCRTPRESPKRETAGFPRPFHSISTGVDQNSYLKPTCNDHCEIPLVWLSAFVGKPSALAWPNSVPVRYP